MAGRESGEGFLTIPMIGKESWRIAVVGAGLMGHGIALEFALGGYRVSLHSRSRSSIERGMALVEESLNRLLGLSVVTSSQAEAAVAKITGLTNLEEAVGDADIVIESVYEDLVLKQELFAQLDNSCPERTILASNTSNFLPSQIASATRRPDRTLVAHYINPPFLVPIVEVVPSPSTSAETVAAVKTLLEEIGKRPVVLKKEVPGFLTVRIQAAVLREALWLVENVLKASAHRGS